MHVSSRKSPCPVCGRTKDPDCRWKDDVILCHHGTTHQPPPDLQRGDVISIGGKPWALIRRDGGFDGAVVGSVLGSVDTDGDLDGLFVGVMVGSTDKDGDSDGCLDGIFVGTSVGVWLGLVVTVGCPDGASEGFADTLGSKETEGRLEGDLDGRIDGLVVGCAEIEGCFDGTELGSVETGFLGGTRVDKTVG